MLCPISSENNFDSPFWLPWRLDQHVVGPREIPIEVRYKSLGVVSWNAIDQGLKYCPILILVAHIVSDFEDVDTIHPIHADTTDIS